MTSHAPSPDPDATVNADETPAGRCPFCERPFKSERARDLHVGEQHESVASEAERRRYEEAREAEADDLWYFHIAVVAALGLIYAILVVVYLVVLQSGAG